MWPDRDIIDSYLKYGAIGTGLWFIGTQFSLLIKNPEDWLSGVAAGGLCGLCLWLRRKRKESK